MSTVDLEKIKNRLRKLMNLYEGAKKINSEGEANNAAAAIQRLLTEYNLSVSDLEQESENDMLEENLSWFKYKSIGGKWEYRLMFVICKWNFCKCFIMGKDKDRRMIIIGKDENVITAKWLHDLLCSRFVEIGKVKYLAYKGSFTKPIGLDTYLRSYLLGCAAGLDTKFQKESVVEKQENEEFGAKVTALVVRNNAAIDNYLQTKYKFTKGRQSSSPNHTDVFNTGYTDGKNTQIHKQVSESKQAQVSKVKMLN